MRSQRTLNLWMTTRTLLSGEYTVEFALEDSSETHDLLTTPDHLMERPDERGVALLHRRRFGRPWVEARRRGHPVGVAAAEHSE